MQFHFLHCRNECLLESTQPCVLTHCTICFLPYMVECQSVVRFQPAFVCFVRILFVRQKPANPRAPHQLCHHTTTRPAEYVILSVSLHLSISKYLRTNNREHLLAKQSAFRLQDTPLLFAPPILCLYFVFLEADRDEQVPLLISCRLRCPHHGRILDCTLPVEILSRGMSRVVYCFLGIELA